MEAMKQTAPGNPFAVYVSKLSFSYTSVGLRIKNSSPYNSQISSWNFGILQPTFRTWNIHDTMRRTIPRWIAHQGSEHFDVLRNTYSSESTASCLPVLRFERHQIPLESKIHRALYRKPCTEQFGRIKTLLNSKQSTEQFGRIKTVLNQVKPRSCTDR